MLRQKLALTQRVSGNLRPYRTKFPKMKDLYENTRACLEDSMHSQVDEDKVVK